MNVDDGGFTGQGGPQSATASLDVVVQAPTSPPVPYFGAGPSMVAVEDTLTPLGLSVGALRDGDATSYRAIVTVAVGRVAFPSTPDNVTVVEDASSATVALTGAGADVRTALVSGTYTPATNWNSVHNGDDTVTVCIAPAADPGTSQCAVVAVRVTAVNDAPTVTASHELVQGLVAPEATAVSMAGLVVADVDVAEDFGGALSVTVSCSSGEVTIATAFGLLLASPELRSGTGSGSGSFHAAVLEFEGDVAAINGALATATYEPDAGFTGDDEVTVTVRDGGHSGAGEPLSASLTIPVVVIPVNSPPSISIPASLSTQEDVPVAVEGVVITDADAGDAAVLVDMSVSHGTLSLGEMTYVCGWVLLRHCLERTGLVCCFHVMLLSVSLH